ncbi:IclR family transcriptional regulator [Amycolatopsis acidicola]|uniref:IclR family transcriptional regulator n=1 Tax=Amycolatopsis acidicola TaxID=2596893 RepID=A0A5N0UP97_9PSEU|nr:IclR family transcriptional regulator [Amycolatopsis acidicola]KAA9149569.1 IclR family transcriptional regulator [Amycolatopsis acidicola]
MEPAATGRGKRPKKGDPVVDRALSLLAAFGSAHRALGLVELSRRAGLPRSTASRLAARLEAWGALERDERGRFVVGLRLFEIASLAPRSHGLREVALPYLEDLHEVTRQHVLLAVRDGAEALLVERLSARDAVEIAYRVGGRMPLSDTGVGLVLLAAAEPEVREQVFARLGDTTALRRQLAEVRRTGIAVFARQRPAAVSSVAVPVRDRSGRVVAAVSVVVPARAGAPQAYEQVVRATALAISRGVG